MGAIEVDKLRKAFPNGVEAVAGIDLNVEHGEIFGFLGPNGAGKSTTTRMLTTLLRPTSGGARVAGLDILKQSAQVRRVIGVALQYAGLDPASRQAIWDEVVHMNRKRGITVFLTTQYLEEADRLANRIAIIDRGRIVAEGSPEELKASIGADIVTVGVPEDQVARAEK